ncbi:MAG: hypothetical protein GXO22_05530 [Aquificae bacterium]|nr:hypothetical protein [Aquificota bacterium]
MKIFLSFILVFAFFFSAFAKNPAPFGMELGKATIEDVNNKFGCTLVKRKEEWIMCFIRPQDTGLDKAEKAVFYFDKKTKILHKVVVVLSESQFKKLYRMLSAKYEIVDEHIPFVGDRYAKYKSGDVIIEIFDPHPGFEMELRYMTSLAQKRMEEKEKRKRIEETKKYLDLL